LCDFLSSGPVLAMVIKSSISVHIKLPSALDGK
jgi:hypothetical protein